MAILSVMSRGTTSFACSRGTMNGPRALGSPVKTIRIDFTGIRHGTLFLSSHLSLHSFLFSFLLSLSFIDVQVYTYTIPSIVVYRFRRKHPIFYMHIFVFMNEKRCHHLIADYSSLSFLLSPFPSPPSTQTTGTEFATRMYRGSSSHIECFYSSLPNRFFLTF